MADFTVAAADRGVRAKTLTAASVDTVTFDRNIAEVEILVATADAENDIWYTTDGSTPAVNGARSVRLIGVRGAAVKADMLEGADVVKLISAGTPTYDVTWTR